LFWGTDKGTLMSKLIFLKLFLKFDNYDTI